MEFAIKKMRMSAGMSQQEVAEKSMMPVRRYGSYERGERMVSLEDAVYIADALGCTLDELAGRTAPSVSRLSDAERELVSVYRRSDAIDRTLIERVAGIKKENGDSVPEKGVA